MKRLVLISIVNLTIISLAVISLVYFNDIKNEVITNLNYSIEYVKNDQVDELHEEIKTAKDHWTSKSEILGIYIHHNHIDTITESLVSLEAMGKYASKSDFIVEAETLKESINRLFQSEIPNFENIL